MKRQMKRQWYTLLLMFSMVLLCLPIIPAEAAQPIKNGTYTIVSALNSGMVLDVDGASDANGANVQLYEKNGTKAQQFKLKYKSGYYTIQNVGSKKMFDIETPSDHDGANVLQWESDGSDGQKWKLISAGNGYYYVKSKLGRYLDVDGASDGNGTNVQVWTGNKTKAQKFKFVKKKTGISSGEYEVYAPDITKFEKSGNTLTIHAVKEWNDGIKLNGKATNIKKLKVTLAKNCKWSQSTPGCTDYRFLSYSTMREYVQGERNDYKKDGEYDSGSGVFITVKGGKATRVNYAVP